MALRYTLANGGDGDVICEPCTGNYEEEILARARGMREREARTQPGRTTAAIFAVQFR